MTNVLQSISSAPVTAMDDDRHWMRSGARRNAQFAELKFTGAVGDLFAVWRRRLLKNALRCAGGHFQQRHTQHSGAQKFTTRGMHGIAALLVLRPESCCSKPFVEMSKLAPFRHDEIAILINRSAVRRI